MLQQGQFVYELYAILVHNGGAFGGHYFVYIKGGEAGADDSKWYNFNDSQVSPISDSEIAKTFGGDGQTNTAYMLMYRRLDVDAQLVSVP